MTLFDTLDHYIRETEADLEGLSLEIREETNFEPNCVDSLSDMYDTVEQHLNNLKQIKQIIQNHEQHS
jgi:hypothetical protein